jgi:hypothetical protein
LRLNQKANANQQIAENVLRQQYRANVEELKASLQGTLGLVIPEPEIFGETNPDKLVYFPYNQTLAKVCLTMANQETSETEGTANDIIGLSSPAITEAIAGESYRLEGNAYVMKQRTITINQMKKSATTTKLSALSAVSAISIAQKAATIPLLYSLMSVNEYITHRFYQHAEFNKITKFLGLNYI